MEKKNILVAIDKFKGSLTSLEAADAVCRGFEAARPGGCEFRTIEIADGGDGSLEVLQKRIDGAYPEEIPVHDPLGRSVCSNILLYTGAGGVCAFIEMAKVSGLEMLAKDERNPLRTSTYGMGEAIREAVRMGALTVTLSIGGSATNDGGAGMLQALGYRFYDTAGVVIGAPICGGDLVRIARIEKPETGNGLELLQGVEFKVICDVTNPLLGQTGATAVYGPQKGADEMALELLEAGLANYAAVAEGSLGVAPHCKDTPGAGAAGGVGYAGLAFLGARLLPGWKFFAEVTALEDGVKWADLVVTGEGSLDSQSLSGKVVSGVLELCAVHKKEVLVLCGVSKLSGQKIRCRSIASLGYPLEVCMSDASRLLERLAYEEELMKEA